MNGITRFKQLLKPSLGKVGLTGMMLCLVLGAYTPAASVEQVPTDISGKPVPRITTPVKPITLPDH